MEDMERYGDYNEVDEEPAKRGPIGLILKILVALMCATVIGVLAVRIYMFNSYPKDVSQLIWTDALSDYYDSTEGDLGAKTYSTRLNYDDPKEGNFFFDELIIVPGADHLQVTVRYNTSLMEAIKTEYKITLDPDADPFEIFEFKLARTLSGYVAPEDGTEEVPTESVGSIGATATAENMMYRYARVAFDGVDFGLDEGETPVGWYRLEITIKGVENMKPYTLPVYNAEVDFTDYTPSRSEVNAR